jgi:hypothetical protein
LLPGGCTRLGREDLEWDRDLVRSELSVEGPFPVEPIGVEREAELVGVVGPRALEAQIPPLLVARSQATPLLAKITVTEVPFEGVWPFDSVTSE